MEGENFLSTEYLLRTQLFPLISQEILKMTLSNNSYISPLQMRKN